MKFKWLHEPFTEKEFNILKAKKEQMRKRLKVEQLRWHDFLMMLVETR